MKPFPSVPLPDIDITRLLNDRTDVAGLSSEELLPLVYEELRGIAARQMAGEPLEHTLQPTALVHEAWLRLNPACPKTWNDREHFFRTVTRTMRRILVDRARRRSSLKQADGAARLSLDDIQLAAATPSDRVLLIHSALAELEREDPASGELVDLKFFGGFTNKEIAWMQDVAERTVERQWAYSKARLFQILQSSE